MMFTDVIYGYCEPDDVEISEREFNFRIGGEGLYYSDEAVNCRESLCKILNYKYAYAYLNLDLSEEGICCLDSERIYSKDLYKNLRDCDEVCIMAVTLGIGADRLLKRLRVSSAGEYLIMDALASSAIESFCDYVDVIIKKDKEKDSKVIWHPRYSPGYGDCSIENQEFLLNRLNGESKLGIMLNKSYFMTPTKSITAIMGMKYE